MNNPQKTINCRICLRSDRINKKYLSLFETYNGCSILEKINSIANVEIKKGDKFPHKICPDCLLQLENAVSFKQKCESSNEILLSTLLPQKQTEQKCEASNKILLTTLLSPKKTRQKSPDAEVELIATIPVKEEILEVEISPNRLEYTDTGEIDEDSTEYHEEFLEPIERKSRAIDLKLICDDCGGSFKSKCKLRVHWKNVHQPEKLICQICKRMFKSYKSFNKHQKTRGRMCVAASKVNIEGQGKSRIFHCPECSYKSKRIKDLDTHLVTHTGDRRFPCKDCGRCFTQYASLQGHRESTHKDFRVDKICHLCGKHLLGRGRYYKHMKSHREEGVQCKVCNKPFKNKRYLTLHMLRHSGVKSYSCEICAASFYTYCELYNHRKKVHMKSRSIKCDLCEYKMCTVTALKKHRAKHTGTNVICLVCGQFSENAEKLAIHQKRHFERNIPCPQCDKMYHNKRSLSKHMCKSHRCTMLVEKREEKPDNLKLECTNIKQESPPPENNEIVILYSPPTVILN